MQELKTEPLTLGQCMLIMRVFPLGIAIALGGAALVVYMCEAPLWVYAEVLPAVLLGFYGPAMVDAYLYRKSGSNADALLRLVDGGLMMEWAGGRMQYFCPLQEVKRCQVFRGLLIVSMAVGAHVFNVRHHPQAAAFVEAMEQARLKAGEQAPALVPPHPEGAELHNEKYDEIYFREVSRLLALSVRPFSSFIWLYLIVAVLLISGWAGQDLWMSTAGSILIFGCLVGLFSRPGRAEEALLRKRASDPDWQWSQSGKTLCISGHRGWWRVIFGQEPVKVVRGQHKQAIMTSYGPVLLFLPNDLVLPVPIGSLRISHPRAELVLRWVAGVALLLSFVWARVFPSQEDEVVRMSQDKVYELAERFQPREYLQYASLTISAGTPERHLSFGTFYGSWSVTLDEKLRVKKVLQWSCGEEDMQPYAWPEAELPPCLNEKK